MGQISIKLYLLREQICLKFTRYGGQTIIFLMWTIIVEIHHLIGGKTDEKPHSFILVIRLSQYIGRMETQSQVFAKLFFLLPTICCTFCSNPRFLSYFVFIVQLFVLLFVQVPSFHHTFFLIPFFMLMNKEPSGFPIGSVSLPELT